MAFARARDLAAIGLLAVLSGCVFDWDVHLYESGPEVSAKPASASDPSWIQAESTEPTGAYAVILATARPVEALKALIPLATKREGLPSPAFVVHERRPMRMLGTYSKEGVLLQAGLLTKEAEIDALYLYAADPR